MAQQTLGLNSILQVLPSLSRKERKQLLERLCEYPEVLEDAHDIVLLLERRREPSRSYQDFVEELRAEGRL
ncbi:MAG: hypothetical protein HY683_02075 [Chloroflexi bacterium]|nr:hypothetical protein [Chloroflexota bacterium]